MIRTLRLLFGLIPCSMRSRPDLILEPIALGCIEELSRYFGREWSDFLVLVKPTCYDLRVS